jgi:hypothetical protein
MGAKHGERAADFARAALADALDLEALADGSREIHLLR